MASTGLFPASRWASMCIAQRPENPSSVEIVLRAAHAGKLSRSSGLRFAQAMMRLSSIPTTEKLGWLVQAARIAEKDLKDLPLALELLRRIRSEYGVEQAGREIEIELGRIESVVSGLRAERASLRDGLDLGEMASSRIRVVEEAEALKRLARISLQFEDGKAEACGILVILMGAGEADWAAAELALVKVEEREPRQALLRASASLAEASAERRPPLPLLEEIVEAWQTSGGADDALLDSVHRAILAISPFNRDSVHHLGTRAAQAGDVDRMVQFTERRIATARPQERGSLYVELASLGDLVPEYADRVPTFWRIASNAMPTHPSVLANDFVELVTARRWDEAASWIKGNISQFPRTHRPALGALMRDLLDRAGDRQAALAAAVEEIALHPWDGALAGEALARSDDVGNFAALADRLRGSLAWHDHDPELVSSMTQFVRGMPRGPETGGALAASARLVISRAAPPSPEIIGLLEVLAWCLADAGDPLLGARCLERALVASTDPEKRTGLVKRIAELLAAAGDQGREALVALVPRAARIGTGDDILGPARAGVADRIGISKDGAATARAIAARSLPPSDRHADLAAAMLLHSMGAAREDVGAVLAAASSAAEGSEIRLLMGALHGKAGDGLGDGMEAAAAGEGDPSQAADLLLRAAEIRAATPGMEAMGVDDAIAALRLAPGKQGAMERAEAMAVALADPARLRAFYEAALPHLPGRKTVQAFHYRFGKIQEETLKDLATAAEMYLQALGVEPRPGAILEAVERVAHRMQRHEPLVRAAGLLEGVEREKAHVAPFVTRNAERFLEEENLASAHALVAEAIALDIRMDLTRVVRLMAERSQAGRASAQKIAQRWVGLLEAAIASRGDDSDLPRRLDAVAALRHEISSDGEESGEVPPAAAGRISIPPAAAKAWSKIVEVPADESEISLVQQASSPTRTAARPEPPARAPAAVPEDSKVTVMPKPMADRRPQADETEKEALRSEPPPPIDVLALAHAATAVPAAPMPPAAQVPPAATAPSAAKAPATAPAIRPAAPRPRMGLRGMERRFHTTSPMPVAKQTREERRAAGPPREAASEAKPAPATILDEIGKREEVEPEVIMRAETVPPTPEMIAEVRAAARTQIASAEPEDSVQVMIGEGDFPELKVERPPSHVSATSETVPMYVPGVEPAGDDPLAALRREPWDMETASRILEGADTRPPGPGLKALLGSLSSLTSDDPALFRHARPTFRDPRATAETFRALLADQAREPVMEVLGMITDAAHHLFKERIGDYGMRIPDQITPFSTGPVAPILEKATRSLGYQSMAVYYRRDQRYEVNVVRKTPPSITVMVPLGKLPSSLEFYMGRGFWAVNPRRLLAFSLPAEEGARLATAMVQAFGRSRQSARLEAGVSAIVQELWKLPAKVQDKARILLAGTTSIDFADLSKEVKAECSRAGILFSGDLGAAVLHDLPAVRPDARGRIDGAGLAEAVRGSRAAQDTIRFALRPDVLAFMDRALGAPPADSR